MIIEALIRVFAGFGALAVFFALLWAAGSLILSLTWQNGQRWPDTWDRFLSGAVAACLIVLAWLIGMGLRS